MQKVLETHVRAHLAELAEVRTRSRMTASSPSTAPRSCGQAWGDGLKPDPLLTVSEWADRTAC